MNGEQVGYITEWEISGKNKELNNVGLVQYIIQLSVILDSFPGFYLDLKFLFVVLFCINRNGILSPNPFTETLLFWISVSSGVDPTNTYHKKLQNIKQQPLWWVCILMSGICSRPVWLLICLIVWPFIIYFFRIS